MNDLLSSFLCGNDIYGEAQKTIVKYIYGIDIDWLYTIFKSEHLKGKVDFYGLINKTYDHLFRLWSYDYGKDHEEYYYNLLKAAFNPKRFITDVDFSKINKAKDMEDILKRYLEYVIPEEDKNYDVIGFLLNKRIKDERGMWKCKNAEEMFTRVKEVLCNIYFEPNSPNDDIYEYKDYCGIDYDRYEAVAERLARESSHAAVVESKKLDGEIYIYHSPKKEHKSISEFIYNMERELYVEMACKNLMQIYLCHLDEAPVKFTKSPVGKLYNFNAIKNEAYIKYKDSCIRKILFDNTQLDNPDKTLKGTDRENNQRLTYPSICFTEYRAMYTTLFRNIDVYKAVEEFIGLLESYFKLPEDKEEYNAIVNLRNEAYNLPEECQALFNQKVSEYFRRVKRLMQRNLGDQRIDLCRVYFEQLSKQFNLSYNKLLEEIETSEIKNAWIMLFCSDYMAERFYGIDLISHIAVTNEDTSIRACSHKSSYASFRQNFTQSALKNLDIRQYVCDFLPCLCKIYARKSAYSFYVNRL